MKIQNSKLAGEALALRFERGVVVQGDDKGVFEVPAKDGEFMLALPGWSAVAEKAPAKAAAKEEAPKVEELKAEEPKEEEESSKSFFKKSKKDKS